MGDTQNPATGQGPSTQVAEPLPPHLAEPSKIGNEISVTGKWIPAKQGGLFRSSAESKEMLREWEDIHAGAKADPGVLSTEINHAVGEDAVLVHHVFKDSDALVHYFSTTATQHIGALARIAKPQMQLVRGVNVSAGGDRSYRFEECARRVWKVPFRIRERGLPATGSGHGHHGHRQMDV